MKTQQHIEIDPDGAPHVLIAGVAFVALLSAILVLVALATGPAHLVVGLLALTMPPSLLVLAGRARRSRANA
jgi:hypothetical protein